MVKVILRQMASATVDIWSGYARLISSLVCLLGGAILWLLNLHLGSDIVWSVGAGVLVVPTIIVTVRSAVAKDLGVDVIAIVAVVAALALGEYAAAMVIVVMLSGGESLEGYASKRARIELTSLLQRTPLVAHLRTKSGLQDVAAGDIEVGDKVVVRPGEIIPVDGQILDGSSSIDESAITGESLSISRQPGDGVLSGSVNQEALLTIKATHTANDSQYQQIVSLVKQAAASRSPIVRLANQYSLPFTALAFGMAGIGYFLSGNILRALEVLVVATPCPLLLATPVAIVSGMSRSARHGIIVKHGAALETLAKIKTVAFDKTGTLTMGQPAVERIVPAKGYTEKELVQLVASVEQGSNHPLAKAVVSYAQLHNIAFLEVSAVEEQPGFGITARTGGHKVNIGRMHYVLNHIEKLTELTASINPALHAAKSGQYIGAIYFEDAARPEAKQTITLLHEQGINKIIMLTGDRAEVAQSLARQLQIKEVYSGLLPSAKTQQIVDIAASGRPVAMIGDGINDAPALRAAEVGIAMGAHGSGVASEAADVVILHNSIQRLPQAIAIARRAVGVAKQGIVIGIGLSFVLMVLAVGGFVRPTVGALLQEAVDVFVILNALRARHGAWGQ